MTVFFALIEYASAFFLPRKKSFALEYIIHLGLIWIRIVSGIGISRKNVFGIKISRK